MALPLASSTQPSSAPPPAAAAVCLAAGCSLSCLLHQRIQPPCCSPPHPPNPVINSNPARTVELYDPRRDAWSAGPDMPAAASFAAAAMLGGQLYVVEGAAHAPHVLSFDRRERHWGSCQPLGKPRVNMAVCSLEGQLYVLVRSGRAGAVQRRAFWCAPCGGAGFLRAPGLPHWAACKPTSCSQPRCRGPCLPPLAGRACRDRQGRVCAAGR